MSDAVDPSEYRATLHCRRCGSVRYISKLAEPFRHWFCGLSDTGYCGTPNVVEAEVWGDNKAKECAV